MASVWDEKAVFLAALALGGDERSRFLESACPDAQFRQRIESLLRHHVEPTKTIAGPQAAVPSLPWPEQLDEFKIVGRLGEGGMGVVYLAHDTILGRQVALKILAGHLTGSEQAMARFREEARSAAALNHPAVVPVFKMGFDKGFHYIVSEYVDGTTLRERIAEERERRKHPEKTSAQKAWHRFAAEAVASIADALDASHRAGILHRDVKPSNILIDRQGRARLTDFGIAKHLTEETVTSTREVAGSCYYMSPEQASIADVKVDKRSDVFSLGVVLYEAVSLTRPFDGSDINQVLRAVVANEPVSLRSVDRLVLRDLAVVCHKALEKKPIHRYQTAAHMAADLRSHLAGGSILAQAPTIAQRVYRWSGRNRSAFVAAIITILASIAIVLAFVINHFIRSQQSVFTFESTPPGAAIFLRDPKDEKPHWREVDTTPNSIRVKPGRYQIVAVGPDQSFAETSIISLRPGESQNIHLRPSAPTDSLRDMILIPGGEYECGDPGRDVPQAVRTVSLRPFLIDQFEVSNAEFLEFMGKPPFARPMPPHWQDAGPPPADDRPVVGISWDDAQAFARARGKRLPTADEWEVAMRGRAARLTPWPGGLPADFKLPTVADRDRFEFGNRMQMGREYLSHVVPVRSHPEWATPEGIFHGSSNVKEWTDSFLTGATQRFLVKGATWFHDPRTFDFVHCLISPAESGSAPKFIPSRSLSTGFRCARSVSPPQD